MQVVLHLVALNAIALAYGTEDLLAEIVGISFRNQYPKGQTGSSARMWISFTSRITTKLRLSSWAWKGLGNVSGNWLLPLSRLLTGSGRFLSAISAPIGKEV